jgi:hypothetical protein
MTREIPGAVTRIRIPSPTYRRIGEVRVGWLKRLIIGDASGRPRATSQPRQAARTSARAVQVHRTPQERRERVWQRSPNVLYRDEYMSAEQEAKSLVLDARGMPTASLKRFKTQLVLVADDGAGMVNTRNTRLPRVGLFGARDTGSKYQGDALLRADLRPGRRVKVVREPKNAHDSNACALHATNTGERFGYVSRGYAKRLAKLMDAGDEWVGLALRGSGPGSRDEPTRVLIARVDVMAHLLRNL